MHLWTKFGLSLKKDTPVFYISWDKLIISSKTFDVIAIDWKQLLHLAFNIFYFNIKMQTRHHRHDINSAYFPYILKWGQKLYPFQCLFLYISSKCN